MAVSPPFFSKREPEPLQSRSPNIAGTPLPTPTARPTGVAYNPTNLPGQSSTSESGSKLTVGPNIKLKGVEITDCDTLVVEGTVEATMNSRVIRIAEQGAFHGTAEIDIAEIHGKFDGTLTVREKLVIYGSGKVSGKIRYGKVVIEEGGELTGQIEVGTGSSHAASASLSKSSTSSASSATGKAGSSTEAAGAAAVA